MVYSSPDRETVEMGDSDVLNRKTLLKIINTYCHIFAATLLKK